MNAERRAVWMSKEVVEYVEGTPVYDSDGDRYYADLQTAIESITEDVYFDSPVGYSKEEDGWEETFELEMDRVLESRLVFACSTNKVFTPDWVSTVEEQWAEEYDNDGWDHAQIPVELTARMNEIQKELERIAPQVWYPVYTSRLSLV